MFKFEDVKGERLYFHFGSFFINKLSGITTVTGKGLLFKHKAKNGDTKFDDCDDCFEQYNTTYLYNVYEQSFDKIFVSNACGLF
jgi:hypothetical protein